MINGHGDDLHNYSHVEANFSSNVYNGFSHQGLFEHLSASMHLVTSYPEPSPLSLERHIAEEKGVKAENVMVTNGATEAIYLIARAFSQFEAVISQPSFSEYADACRHNHGQDHLRWFCIPNNPTGQVMPRQDILRLVAEHPTDIFVVDASYAAYTKEKLLSVEDIISRDNVLMLSSMTKDYGVPGLRLGYVVANCRLLDSVRAERMPWSVNALAIEAGHYLLSHRDEYQIPIERLIAERQRMEAELHAMGISTYHSDSHMLLCVLPHGDASTLKQDLVQNHGILIRDASNFETLSPQHFRIAVQNEKQNNELLKALRQWI